MASIVAEPILVIDGPGVRSAAQSEAATPAVSWAAVAAGAFVAAATALILLALGAGAGLSSLSPWASSGCDAVLQSEPARWRAACDRRSRVVRTRRLHRGARLRTRWVSVHTHEVYFRDTAHGFLVWAVALVMTAAFLTSAASTMVGAESRAASAAASGTGGTDAHRYFVDRLFRSEQPASSPDATSLRVESSVILAHALAERQLAPDDRAYLVQAVTSHTGVSRSEAEARVTAVFADDQQALDTVRKATAHALYWLFVALPARRVHREPDRDARRTGAGPRPHGIAGNSRRRPPRRRSTPTETHMRSILLLFLGVPIPIIIIIGLFSHF